MMFVSCNEAPVVIGRISNGKFVVSGEFDLDQETLYWSYDAEVTLNGITSKVTDGYADLKSVGLKNNNITLSTGDWVIGLKGFIDTERKVLIYESETSATIDNVSYEIKFNDFKKGDFILIRNSDDFEGLNGDGVDSAYAILIDDIEVQENESLSIKCKCGRR